MAKTKAKRQASLEQRVSAYRSAMTRYNPEECDFREGAKAGWGRKTRPNGTHYSFPVLIGGTKCVRAALVTRRENGKTVRRCARHLTSSYFD